MINVNNVNDDMYVNRNYTRNNSREEYKRLRGRAARRRDRTISDKLHEVHKPYDSRPIENTVQHDGTILFDLT